MPLPLLADLHPEAAASWTSLITGAEAPEHVAVDEPPITPMGKVGKPALVAQWEAGGHR
jgi:hypothetical protein